MYKFIYIENEISNNTKYKTLKTVIDNGDIKIRYFPRDKVYCIDCINEVSDKIMGYLKSELQLLYPNSKLVN